MPEPRYVAEGGRLVESGVGHVGTIELPDPVGRLGYWVTPSPIPDTLPWEWVVTNVSCHVFPGLTNGYTDTEREAYWALRAALGFWRARGYATVDLPALPAAADAAPEIRMPDMDRWSGIGVAALHSHPVDEPCDDHCSIYEEIVP